MIHEHWRPFVMLIVFFVGTGLLFPHSPSAQVLINELLASTAVEDDDGEPLEWIELYNAGDASIDLAGHTISDNAGDPRKWVFPSVSIPAGGFLTIWATGKDTVDATGPHANFRLDRGGESLGLFSPQGVMLDTITFPKQYTDYSYGRYPDGGGAWQYFEQPTREAPNDSPGKEGIAADARFSRQAGVYEAGFQLELQPEDLHGTVYYTLDGSIPDETDLEYAAPIAIAEPTIVRARVFRDGYYPGDVRTKSYIIRTEIHIPIVSLVTEPDNLWDRRTGIYANSSYSGSKWERPVSVELFTISGERAFREDCGIRIHGGASRTRSPRRSFRLYFRSEYGPAKLEYPLFPDSDVDKFDVLVLRGGFNDTWTYDNPSQRETAIYVSDQVVRDLDLDLGRTACHGFFIEVYLNGQYWGLYNLTERLNEDFMESYFGNKDWDVIVDNSAANGDMRTWARFILETNSSNMQEPENYQRLQTELDLQAYTDYILLNVWMQNYDWPHHNWCAARAREDGAAWHFFVWDVEYSFGSGMSGYRTNQNTWHNAAQPGQQVSAFFYKLIENEDYREYVWNRMHALRDTILSPQHVMDRLDARLNEIRDVIPAEAERWAQDKNLEEWERAVQLSRDFIAVRWDIVEDYAQELLGPPPVSVDDWSLYDAR